MSIDIFLSPFPEWKKILANIRLTVFVEEQGVPQELEMDDRDENCIHLLARIDGLYVGTVRLDPQLGGKIGRLAVLSNYRRLGVATGLMKALHNEALKQGMRDLWCHSQVDALAFYQKLGYEVEGETFMEAGIPHRQMRVSLMGPVVTS